MNNCPISAQTSPFSNIKSLQTPPTLTAGLGVRRIKNHWRLILTQLLKKAFEEASKLPELEQNALARWLIDEVISERKWEKAFAEPEDVLDKLADEALAEHAQGKTKLLDIDQL